MSKVYTKTVLLPIKVAPSEYCWDGHVSCQYFDNEGGHAHCTLGVGFSLTQDKTGYPLKPAECAALEEVK